MTAVEVLVASMLSALLMVAVMGTMRGLKAHERALELRDPTASWQRSLSYVLQQDLDNTRTIKVSPQFIELDTISGASAGNVEDAWLPVKVRYDIRRADSASWLVRTEIQGAVTSGQLVCRDVVTLRVSQGGSSPSALDAGTEQPLTDGLTIEFLQANGRPVFQYVFRQM